MSEDTCPVCNECLCEDCGDHECTVTITETRLRRLYREAWMCGHVTPAQRITAQRPKDIDALVKRTKARNGT